MANINLSDVSLYVLCAILGNWWGESNINPGIWEGLQVVSWDTWYHGYGFGQWTNTSASNMRLQNLYNYMTAHNYDPWDPYGQIEFLLYENVWYQEAEASAYSSLTDFLLSTDTDITALTHAWCIGWEGIHDSSWDTRVQHAYDIYSYIMQHANDPSITAWTIENNFLSVTDLCNNGVLLYRYFDSGAILPVPTPPYPPVPPEPGKGKKHMPVWMMIRYF